jgi:hypothetical protein
MLLLSLEMWGSNGQNKAGIGLDLLMVLVLLVFLVVVLPLLLVQVDVIFGYRKKRSSNDSRVLLPLNLCGLIHKAPRKSTMENTKDLLLLSLKKKVAKVEIWRGPHVPFCGFSDRCYFCVTSCWSSDGYISPLSQSLSNI